MIRIPCHFMPYQARWVRDHSRLKLIEKSRQIGIYPPTGRIAQILATRRDRPVLAWR